jgi:type I restriction enzyme S subunit
MELKPGYKQTEVGVIPEDWEIVTLGALTDQKRPISYGIVQTGPSVPNGVRCLRVLDIQDGRINKSNLITTTKAISDTYKRTTLRSGDLIMPLRGKIGDVAVVDDDLVGCNLTRGIALIAICPDWSALFCKQFISSIATRSRLEQTMNGSALQEIPIAALRIFRIVLPPTKAEQEAIADALNDADALIESLEQLLAKKRQIKQGAMQELLTGRKRLPGFGGKWEVKRLDELGRWTGGMTPSMRNPDYWQSGTVPWVSSGDVKSVMLTSTAFAVSESAIKRKATPLIPAKSLIVVTRSGILRKLLPVAMNMIPMAINQDIKALLPNNYVLAEYLLHTLTCNGSRILASCLKSGTTVESIEFPWLKAFTISIPPLAEQAAIATVLSDMDAEITALEAKLAKARQIKQGMMQELLTGRIRLV